VLLACAAAMLTTTALSAAAAAEPVVELKVRPRVCTLSANDRSCETTVSAEWRAAQDESLCLVIVGRADVKRCWESYSEGRYSIELAFAEDLLVELRDVSLERVLASQAITVIREALQLRRKRKQPWNLFS
jgi:hypothetical protein